MNKRVKILTLSITLSVMFSSLTFTSLGYYYEPEEVEVPVVIDISESIDEPEEITIPIEEEPLLVVSECEEVEEIEEEYDVGYATAEDIQLLALVTMAEAEGESDYGKRLVIDTILNRVDSEHFPNTIENVIYQRNQFTSMWNGRIDRVEITPDILELVEYELYKRTNYEVMFFTAGSYGEYGKPMFPEGNHYFSKY